MPKLVLPDSGLAHRYLDGWQGIEIGGSKNNPFNIDRCVNVDYSAEHTSFKSVEIDMCGESLPVDVVAEADALPFGDDSQDYVITSHVFEHMANPIKAMREWVRVTRPGGIIFLIIPHIDIFGAHPADKDREPTPLDHFQEDFDRDETVDTHPIPPGHEKRGHYHCFDYKSFKAFIARFFAGTLEWIDGEPIDRKIGNGHTHVLRVIKPTADGAPRIDVLPTRKRIWLNLPDETGCTYYRQVLPFNHCREILAADGIDLHAGGHTGGTMPDASYDAYVFQRTTGMQAFGFLHWIKKSGRKIVWDLDDDFLAIPEWSPAFNAVRQDGSLANIPIFLDMADAITVTNERLRERLCEEFDFLTPNKIHVLPNLVEADRFKVLPEPRPIRAPRILWTGSAYHAADLELLVPVVRRLVEETDFEFVFMGDVPKPLRELPIDRVWHLGGAHIRYYAKLLCELGPDVALMPLTGCLFDQSKSAIKWYECTLAGAACVASNVGPYGREIRHRVTGILVENDPDSWCSGIREALDNHYWLWSEAQQVVLDNYSWQSAEKNKWVEFFRRVVRDESKGESGSNANGLADERTRRLIGAA